MTTFRGVVLLTAAAAAWAGLPGSLSAAVPTELTWSVGTFAGEGAERSRLPRLLTQGWQDLGAHRWSETEGQRWAADEADQAERSRQKALAQKALAEARGTLGVPGPASPPATSAATVSAVSSPLTGQVPLRPLWPAGRTGEPWPETERATLALSSSADLLVTGSFRSVAGYLAVEVEVARRGEPGILGRWEGRFSSEEAPAQMAAAADSLRGAFLGRPWARAAFRSAADGARVEVAGRWHTLPWTSPDQKPGPLSYRAQAPGRDAVTQVTDLPANTLVTVEVGGFGPSAAPLRISTEPPGASISLDSRYLGTSPLQIDRPLATARLRAWAADGSLATRELGPDAPAEVALTLVTAPVPPPLLAAKDRFYLSLAAFSASLTSASLTGAWAREQANLVNAYALSGSGPGYDAAYGRYQVVNDVYAGLVVLTAAVFVGMMAVLGDYLAAAQASLP